MLRCSDFRVPHGGKSDVTVHISGKKYKAIFQLPPPHDY